MTVRNRPVRDPHAGVVWEGRSREAPPYPDWIAVNGLTAQDGRFERDIGNEFCASPTPQKL